MAKYWIGTGTRFVGLDTITQPGEIDMQSARHEDIGLEVDADNLTVETSGVLTLWKRDMQGHRSSLIMAFAVGQWTKAHLVEAAMPGLNDHE